MNKENNYWGVGWDYLFETIWPELDQLREDNLNFRHDEAIIEICFSFMYKVLCQDAVAKLKETDWSAKDKHELLNKFNNCLELFRKSQSLNDKVIAINVTEQLLRAIY